MVMDKSSFPRDKVCAGWITPAVFGALQLDPRIYPGDLMLQPIMAFRTGLINGSELESRYPTVVSFGIRRCEFDDYLLQRSGARSSLGQTVTSLKRRGRQWLINDTITTPMLIGAGGHFCPVARFLGAKLGADEPAVAAKEIEFEMDAVQAGDCQVRADTPELYFCEDLKGYGWCFRKGQYLNIGLGREGSHGLTEALRNFCAFLKRRGRIPQDVPDSFHGHAYLRYGHGARKRVDDGVLLVGDAAGLAYPQSGEGIRPAVESGLMAAATILEAGKDYRSQRLAPYGNRLLARYGPSALRRGGSGPALLRNFLAGALLGNRWFTRHVVLDRWFLHSHQAQLKIC